MSNFYIATRLENFEAQRELARCLKALGHTQTYDWTEHGAVQSGGPTRIRQVANAEAQGVVAADLFVALLPGGRGTHCELGVALGHAIWRRLRGEAHAEIHLIGPLEQDGRITAFYLHDLVTETHATIWEFLAKIGRRKS